MRPLCLRKSPRPRRPSSELSKLALGLLARARARLSVSLRPPVTNDVRAKWEERKRNGRYADYVLDNKEAFALPQTGYSNCRLTLSEMEF